MQNQQQSIDTHLQSHFMSDDALQAEQIEPQSQENYDYYELNIPNLTSQSSEYSEPPILSYSYSGISNASSTPEFTMHSSRVSEQQTQHFIFHKPQKIFICLQKLVKQVKDVVALEDDLVLYVLFKYQWNKQRLFQDYYSHCSPYVQANKLVKQYNNKQQTTGTCIICDTMQPLLSNPVCHHKYCHQCWKSYMAQKLKSNIPFPGCMQKCPDSPLLLFCFTEHYFPQLFEMYRKIICINYAAINKSITYCPNDKCELFCERVQAGYDIYVQCHCGEIFCFYCRKEPHYPATCEDFCKWSKLVNDQSSSNQWIAKNTKVCPCCKQSVQKYIGCSKIKCVCGAQFCYQCNAKWDENHKSSKGQCVSLARKSSLEQRTSTTAFLQLHQKSLAISRTLKRHIEIITTVLQYIKQEWIMNKFIGLKKEITEAWQALKWGNILSFIYKRNEVEATIQEDFIESIGKVMESVEKMKNIANLISPKDMMAVGDEVIARRQCLRKNRQIWFEAWRSCN